MTTKSAELEQIRDEMYPGVPDARAGTGNAAGANAGSRAANPPPRTSAGAAPGAGRAVGTVPCPTCGEPVRAQALYCNKCGTRLR